MVNNNSHSSCISIRNLSKHFVKERKESVLAVDNVSLEIEQGSFVCLLGPTGCGKTTLLRLIGGLEEPTSGSLSVNNGNPQSGRSPMGFVFQQNALFPWRTVLQNITFGLEVRGWTKRDSIVRARECLEIVQLSGVENSYPYELSGGMQQRASLARSLAPSPSILLMDEPFGALDERTRLTLQNELVSLWRDRSLTIVFVTHNIEESVILGQRVIVMRPSPGQIFGERAISLPYPRNRMSEQFISTLLEVRGMFESAMEGA